MEGLRIYFGKDLPGEASEETFCITYANYMASLSDGGSCLPGRPCFPHSKVWELISPYKVGQSGAMLPDGGMVLVGMKCSEEVEVHIKIYSPIGRLVRESAGKFPKEAMLCAWV